MDADQLLDLLPHRPPMRLLERQLERDGERVVCTGRVPPGAPTVSQGECSAMLGLELAAQAAICLRLPPGEAPPPGLRARIGYLVGIRRAKLHTPTLPVGRALRVELERRAQQGGLNQFTARVAFEDEPEVTLVEGQISTFETDRELPEPSEDSEEGAR